MEETMKISTLVAAFALSLLIGGYSSSRAAVVVSSGYYDLSPDASNGGPPLPDPWVASANTTFYGSTSDVTLSTGSDPDISALLLQNTGVTDVSLSALSLSIGMDVLARATAPAGNLSAGNVTLAPGQNYIFGVGDGSEENLDAQTISLTIDAKSFSFSDATTTLAPDGVLFGDVPQLGNGDETQPWTVDGTTSVPEPATFALPIAVVIAVLMKRRRPSALS
jgi:hypothetical protein